VTAPDRQSAPAREPSGARQRILDAAVSCVARDGAAEASMGAIAAEAGVSKALLHYHYSDRARLLAEVVTQLGDRLLTREQAALDEADGRRAVDALWRWAKGELARGELRVLLELSLVRGPLVHTAAMAVAEARRRAASHTSADLLARLGLVPRVPVELIGAASVAFMDGLVLDCLVNSGDPRITFDVFWLAMLSLTE
jgi:AcrR family transcriptional regulator